jgi:homoserine dehydrogenase
MRIHIVLSMLAAVAMLAACATNPVSGDRELALVSEAQEIQIGKNTAEQAERQFGLVEDAELQAYVHRLGLQLAQASERPELPWTFRVADDPTPNAFAAPGGYIFITRGLLVLLRNEAELVSILGHEIGHVTARHSVAMMSRAQLAQLGLGIGSILSPTVAQFGDLAAGGLQLLFLSYSLTDDPWALLHRPADLVIDVLGDSQLAFGVISRALRSGKDVVTANKPVMAHHGPLLEALAHEHGQQLAYSASVGGSLPCVELVRAAARRGRITGLEGVLNGTCNFILDRLAAGEDFGAALADAQRRGFAEADPTQDLSGQDAASKLRILVREAFGRELGPEDLSCLGIEACLQRTCRRRPGSGGLRAWSPPAGTRTGSSRRRSPPGCSRPTRRLRGSVGNGTSCAWNSRMARASWPAARAPAGGRRRKRCSRT